MTAPSNSGEVTAYALLAAPHLRFASATEAVLFALVAGISADWRVA